MRLTRIAAAAPATSVDRRSCRSCSDNECACVIGVYYQARGKVATHSVMHVVAGQSCLLQLPSGVAAAASVSSAAQRKWSYRQASI